MCCFQSFRTSFILIFTSPPNPDVLKILESGCALQSMVSDNQCQCGLKVSFCIKDLCLLLALPGVLATWDHFKLNLVVEYLNCTSSMNSDYKSVSSGWCFRSEAELFAPQHTPSACAKVKKISFCAVAFHIIRFSFFLCTLWHSFIMGLPITLLILGIFFFVLSCIQESLQLLSRVWLFATPWTAARQASLSNINSRSLLKLMSIESVMPSNHLILCCPLLLSPSIFPSIRVFCNESVLPIR